MRSRNHTFIAGILILLEVVGALASGVGGSTADRIVAVALPAWFILDDVVTALRITPDAVRVTTAMGAPSRTLRYVDIDRVSLGTTRAGPAGARTIVTTLELITKRGSRLRIVPYRYADFYGPDGWAARLKAALEAQRVSIDADVAHALAKASADLAPSGSEGYAQEPFQ